MDKVNVGAAIGVGIVGAFLLASLMRKPIIAEEIPEPTEAKISAELREGQVYWAALAGWRRVYERWPNEWPADTDLTFAWDIRNTGDVGAYFQVYIFTPGAWTYLNPNDRIQVMESYHTPAVPVVPSYHYHNIYILGRKLDGTRIGAVWTSEEIEVRYV